jgi:hypothetical protein
MLRAYATCAVIPQVAEDFQFGQNEVLARHGAILYFLFTLLLRQNEANHHSNKFYPSRALFT